MTDFSFHFLRPEYLLLILPLAALLWILCRLKPASSKNISEAIPSEFQNYLLVDNDEKRSNRGFIVTFIIISLLATTALAGPAWRKVPQPVEQKREGLVIVLDLSYSMLADDIKPNRFTRARFKITDLIEKREEGLTGLVAYAGTAHVVTPLTDDTRTISSLTDALDPTIAPIPGSEAHAGIRKAIELLQNSQLDRGTILLVTDGVEENQIGLIRRILKPMSYNVSILGVGTLEGAPIRTPQGQLLRTAEQKVIVPRLPEARLQELARSLGGAYRRISVDDEDINFLTSVINSDPLDSLSSPTLNSRSTQGDQSREVLESDSKFDQWYDEGHWFVFAIIPFALFAFRRGVIFTLFPTLIFFTMLPLSSLEAVAEEPSSEIDKPVHRSVWLTQDQAGQRAFDQGAFDAAAELFESDPHKAAALYKNQAYQEALSAYRRSLNNDNSITKDEQANLHYNLGNTLAQLNQWEESLAAYDQALSLNSQHEAAQHNRELIKKIMERSQQQQNSDQQNQPDEQHQDSADQQNSDFQNGGNQDSQNTEQSSQNQQTEEQSQTESANQQQEQNEDRDDPFGLNSQGNEAQEEKEDEEKSQTSQQQQNEQNQEGEERSLANNENSSEESQNEQGDQTQGLSSAIPHRDQAYINRWLQQLPDSPGNLLRNKFYLQSVEEERARRQGKTTNKDLRQNPDIYW